VILHKPLVLAVIQSVETASPLALKNVIMENIIAHREPNSTVVTPTAKYSQDSTAYTIMLYPTVPPSVEIL